MSRSHRTGFVKPFFRVVSTDDARARIASLQPVRTESAPVASAAGRVLARALDAPLDVPHFHRADMDGYAVRARDTFGASDGLPAYLRVVGDVEMGREVRRRVRVGQAMRIATGGMLPPGANAVVMVEYTDEPGDGTVEVCRAVSPWQHVLRKGEDIKRGTRVFSAGRRLRPRDIGALTGLGLTRVSVFRSPRLGLISTGDEIVPPERTPRPGQVRNINQYSLSAMAIEAGAIITDYGVVADRRERLTHALAAALKKNDVVMISGGSSVGVRDLTVEVIEAFPRSEIVFHGISVAPGKPTILALVGDTPIVGLPGHPVSAIVIFELFVAPLLRIVGGERSRDAFAPRRVTRARLAENVASRPGREDYVRVRLMSAEEGRLACPLPGKSGAVFHLVQADGLVRVPAPVEGLDAGVEVEVLLL